MEWLTQNWIWIAALVGVVVFIGLSRNSHGGHGGGDSSGGHGGCCGGHGKKTPSDKPGAVHGHQH
ncbi:MAG: hypothetical protein Q8K18_11485 [Burkholderiales bacterium]|nr:hypothetical protein [Burkholderiales bacterium]